MQKVVCLVLLCVLVGRCQRASNPQEETEAVKGALHAFFRAISDFDYSTLRASCATDYVLLEDGVKWTVDSLTNAVKVLQNGRLTIGYSLHNIAVHIQADIAWITYDNVGILSAVTGADTLRWVESAVFRKEAGSWKMALLHSTRVHNRN